MRPLTTRTTFTATRIVPAVLVALVLAAGPLAAMPAMADDATDVTWGVRTAENDQGADRKSFSYDIDPGESLSDAMIITNHNAVPLELDLYAADGFTTTSGQLDVATADAESLAVGDWVDFDTEHVVIPAGESIEAPFTITIPDNVTPGDYAGGVISSLLEPDEEEGINVDRRLGIRIHLRISGELVPSIAVDDLKVTYAGTLNPFATGDATVSYTLRNTGNARLEAGQAVSLAGPFGMLPLNASDVEDTPELLPGESWDMTVRLTGVVPAFVLTSTVVLSPAVVDTEDGATTTIDSVNASATTWAVPWALLIVLLLLAAVIVGAVLLTRRRRRVQKDLEDARVQDAVERALREKESLATPAS